MISYFTEDVKFVLKGKLLNNRWLKMVVESEVKRLGFECCIVPKLKKERRAVPNALELIEVKTIQEALAAVIGAKRKPESEEGQ